MFRLMLNAHPNLVIPGETWFLSDVMDALPLTGSLSRDQVATAAAVVMGHWRWKEWGLKDAALDGALDALEQPTLGEVITTLFGLHLPSIGTARWGDKTPGYLTEVDRLHTVLPQARFIHLVRDGRDVCLSLKRTGWHGETTLEIARYWGSAVAAAHDAGQSLPPRQYLEIAYERLVLDTEKVLRRVCEFLDEPFDSRMLRFYETAGENIPSRSKGHLTKTYRPPRPSDVNRWKKELPRRQTAVFEAFAGSTLEKTGYDLEFQRGRGLVLIATLAVDWLARSSLPVRRRLGLHFPRLRKQL